MATRRPERREEMQQNATPCNNIHAIAEEIFYNDLYRKPLSEKQKLAVELLLQGRSDHEAAAQVGVDRSTIFRWRNHPRFANELEAQRRLRRERAANHLQSMLPSALKILQEQLDSRDNRERLRAVSILLRFATPSRLASAPPTTAANPAAYAALANDADPELADAEDADDGPEAKDADDEAAAD